MKIKNLAMIVAASGLAIAPAATASAQVRASASLPVASMLQDEMVEEDDDGGGTAVWLALALIILLGIIVTARGGGEPGPISPG